MTTGITCALSVESLAENLALIVECFLNYYMYVHTSIYTALGIEVSGMKAPALKMEQQILYKCPIYLPPNPSPNTYSHSEAGIRSAGKIQKGFQRKEYLSCEI